MAETRINNHAGFIWSVADLLRGDYKQSEYGKVVLPLTVLRRLDLDERDQLLFEQFEKTWAADPDVVDQARSNTLESFRLVFDHRFLDTVVSRMDENEAIFKRILDDEEFRQVLMDLYAGRVYRKARRPPEEQ